MELNRKANIKWLKSYCVAQYLVTDKFGPRNNSEFSLAGSLLSELALHGNKATQKDVVNFFTQYIIDPKEDLDALIDGLIYHFPPSAFSRLAKKRILNAINYNAAYTDRYCYLAKRMNMKKAIPAIKKEWKRTLNIPEIGVLNWKYGTTLAHLDDEEAWTYLLDTIQKGLNSNIEQYYDNAAYTLSMTLHKRALKILINELDKDVQLYVRGTTKSANLKSGSAAYYISIMLEEMPRDLYKGMSYTGTSLETKDKIKKWIRSQPIDKIKLKYKIP